MKELLTLQKASPEFIKYLDGSFAKDKRAIPLKSLNINTAQESVTFAIVPLSEIAKPRFLKLVFKTLKLNTWIPLVFPMFLILAKNYIEHQIKDSYSMLAASFGIFFLYAGLNFRNDYNDHMIGLDRINPQLGSQSIQNGWITASMAKRWSVILIALAFVCSLIVFFVFPQILIFLGLIALVCYLGFFSKIGIGKNVEGSELVLFLLFGPLLTCGYEISLSGVSRKESLFFGFVWGWIALFPLHLKNFIHLLTYSQAGIHNLVSRKGFDGGKRFVIWWWWIGFLGFLIYHICYAGIYWTWFNSFFLLIWSMKFSALLRGLQSPLSSDLRVVARRGGYLFVGLSGLWFFEFLWNFFLSWKF